MPSPIKLSITADDRDLYNKLVRSEKKVDELKKKLQESGNAGSSSFGKAGKEMDKAAISAGKLLGGTKDWITSMTGIGSALGAVTMIIAKYKELIEAQKESRKLAADTAVTLDQARAAAMLNLPNTFEGGTAEFDRMMKRVAAKSGMPLSDVYKNAGGPLSAKGSATNAEFEDAFGLSAEIQRRTGGAVQSSLLAGSILDVMKSTGLKTSKEALGYIRQIGAAARVQTLEGQLKLVPGLAIGKSLGDSPEMAAELQAAISQQIVDPDGSRTGVLYKGMATALYSDELIPYQKVNPKTGRRETKFRGVEGSNTLERLNNLSAAYRAASDEMKKEMVSKLSERQISVLLPALQGSESWKRNLAAAQEEITAPSKESARFTNDLLRDFRSSPFAQVADARAQIANFGEEISAGNGYGAMRAVSDELWLEVNRRVGRVNVADIMNLEGMAMLQSGKTFGKNGTKADAFAAYIAANPDQFPMDEKMRNEIISTFTRFSEQEKIERGKLPIKISGPTFKALLGTTENDRGKMLADANLSSPNFMATGMVGTVGFDLRAWQELNRIAENTGKKLEQLGDKAEKSAKKVGDNPPDPNAQNFD